MLAKSINRIVGWANMRHWSMHIAPEDEEKYGKRVTYLLKSETDVYQLHCKFFDLCVEFTYSSGYEPSIEVLKKQLTTFIVEMKSEMARFVKMKRNKEVDELAKEMDFELDIMSQYFNEKIMDIEYDCDSTIIRLRHQFICINYWIRYILRDADNVKAIIPTNEELTDEQKMVKEKMIEDVIEYIRYSIGETNGVIYGGAVRDRIRGVLPEDIDLAVGYDNSIRFILKKFFIPNTTMIVEEIEKYWSPTDHRQLQLVVEVCRQLVDRPEFFQHREVLAKIISGEYSSRFDLLDETLKKIADIGIEGKFTLNDVLHLRYCKRIILERDGVFLNVDVTRHIETDMLKHIFGIEFQMFDFDVNTLYYSRDEIKSYITDDPIPIIENIQMKQCRTVPKSYGCAEYRRAKMIEKGYTIVE
jgi:hypothetical protein